MSIKIESEYIGRLRDSLSSPAVLKLKLAQLRADAPNIVVVAFEGVDDKLVYRQWIKRISSHFVYEPLVAKGKRQVIDFRSSLARDKAGLNKSVYFIVDRDFDEHDGTELSDNLFIASRHSIENYLVDQCVLDRILADAFDLDGRIAERNAISAEFSKAYDSFLKETRDLNWLLFLSSRLKIRTVKHLPDSIGKIVKVDLSETSPTFSSPDELVVLSKEVLDEDVHSLRPQFDRLDAKRSYRGKFAFLFFQAWLGHLSELFASGKLESTVGVSATGKPRREQLIISTYASVSELPDGLSNFVQMMEAA